MDIESKRDILTPELDEKKLKLALLRNIDQKFDPSAHSKKNSNNLISLKPIDHKTNKN